MSTNSNPSVQWIQELNKQLEALWQSLNQLQAEYEQAKASFESLDANSKDPAVIQQRQEAEKLFKQTEVALNKERLSLLDLEKEYKNASNACEFALKRLSEEKDVAFNISTSAGELSKGMTEISEAYGSVAKVMALCGVESKNLTDIQKQLNDIITITNAIQKVSAVLSSKSAFQTQIVARVTSAWTTAQTYLNTQLGISVGLSKLLMTGGIGLLIAGIGLLINHFQKLRKEQEENARLNRVIEDSIRAATLESKKNAISETSRLKLLYDATQDTTRSLEERRKASLELQKIFPQHFANFSQEEIIAGKAKKAYDKLTDSIIASAKARALADQITENHKKILELEVQNENDQFKQEDNNNLIQETKKRRKKNILSGFLSPTRMMIMTNVAAYNTGEVKYLENQNKQIDEEIKNRKKVIQRLEEANKKHGKDINIEDLLRDDDTNSGNKNINPEEDYRLIYEKKVSDTLIALQHENRQKEISLMKEGAEKKKAQIKLDYEKELAFIIQEMNGLADENEGILPINLQVNFENAINLLNETKEKSLQQVNEEEIKEFDLLLDSYQDYTDKRRAILEKFHSDIATMEAARAQAENEGNKDRAEQLSRSIAHATKEKGMTLAGMDLEQLKKEPEYIQAFQNLKQVSQETLTSLMNQLRISKEEAEDVLSPDQLREYNDAIQAILDEFNSRNPYQALIDRKEELAQAERELAEAKRDLDDVQEGRPVVKSTQYNQVTGKIDVTYLTAAEAAEKYAKAEKNVANAGEKVKESQDQVKEQFKNLVGEIRNLGDAIGGEAGEILNFIADVYTFVDTSIEGINKVGQAGAEALSMVEKASVILAIIGAAVKLIQKLASFLPDSHDDYLKYAAKIQEINKLREAVTNYELAVLKAQQADKGWFAQDGLKSLKDAYDVNQKAHDAYFEKAGEEQAIYQNKSGSGWATKSIQWVYNNTAGQVLGKAGEYKEGTTAAVNNLRIETRKAKKGILGSGIGGKSQKTEDLTTWAKNNLKLDLFDSDGFIDTHAAGIILDKYGNKLQGETKATLEELVRLKEEYDEYQKQLREYVSSLYEPLVENFVDSLWDWFDEGKDALDSFKEHASGTFRSIVSDMMKTIILQNVVGSFGDDIQDLYKKYSEGGLSETALMNAVAKRTDQLMGDYEKNIPALQNMMTTLSDSMAGIGIDLKQSDSSDQQSSRKGFEAMSQETGSELNGRFTALQMAGEAIRLDTALHTQLLTESNMRLGEIYTVNAGILNVADDTRNTIVNSYLELQEIRENTGAIVKPIREMVTDIREIKENTSRI